MNSKQLNEQYIERFIGSMETDFEQWKMTHHDSIGWSWTEFHSPDYENESGRLSFGFSLNHHGAWVDGFFRWSLPMLNPLTKTYWRFRRAKNRMMEFHHNEEEKEHIKKLKSVL